MTHKTRYFFIAASLVLAVGIAVGLVAYYNGGGFSLMRNGMPEELRYVPRTAELVAYADIQSVMNSDLRRELERMAGSDRRGRREFNDMAGIDFEKQVHHVVGYLEPDPAFAADAASAGKPAPVAPPAPNAPNAPNAPPASAPDGASAGKPAPEPRGGMRGLMLAQGSFEQQRVEQYITEHGGTIEDYHGKHISIHRESQWDGRPPSDPLPDGRRPGRPRGDMAVGFLEPNVIAVGDLDSVRRAIDQSAASGSAGNVTSNDDLMRFIRDASGETAWVVGQFDAVSRRIGMPREMRAKVPPLRVVAAKAKVNGGVRATIRAETEDQAAADQMRDMIRGFVALARLAVNEKPELQTALQTLELGGTGSTVQLSFSMTPETLRAVVPHRPERGTGNTQ